LALLVNSVMQARVLRFRTVNLTACVVLVGYNAALSIWPMVAMNVALVLVNGWHLRAPVRTRNDTRTYAVLEVGLTDAYLGHVLAAQGEDSAKFQSDLELEHPDIRDRAFIIQREDETVGEVLVRIEGSSAVVRLDYVTRGTGTSPPACSSGGTATYSALAVSPRW
jgi:hypothetical protein